MSHRTTDPATPPTKPPDPPRGPEPAPASDLLRILVVDGDHRVRDSLADLIGLADGVRVVGTTSRPAETLEAIDRLQPGVVVIDPYLPDLASGLALIGALRASGHALRIVATCRDDGLDAAALAAGAHACVDRCADPGSFQAAVLAAAQPIVVPADPAGASGERDRSIRPGHRDGARRPALPKASGSGATR